LPPDREIEARRADIDGLIAAPHEQLSRIKAFLGGPNAA
jgi:hypothetical protein